MEPYIAWALLSALFAGFFNFFQKTVAHKDYDMYLFTAYTYIVAFFLSTVTYLLKYGNFSEVLHAKWVLLFALGNTIFYFLTQISRIESLKNIDTVIFYPIYKTFGPINITLISLFLFKEHLTIHQAVGIMVGITIPLLLINTGENKIQKNLKRGIIFLSLTILFGSITPLFAKYIEVLSFNRDLFMLLSFFFGIVISCIGYRIYHRETKKQHLATGVVGISILAGICQYSMFYFYVLSMQGNLAVAFTINSFSILIPIILSIMFYGEHFSLKKAVVIGLSIVSILLFI